MSNNTCTVAECAFENASAKATLFELRARLLASTIPAIADLSINTKLGVVLKELVKSYDSVLNAEDKTLLEKACTLRNKLLHCEFSAARQRLDELNPRPRAGEVTELNTSGLDQEATVNNFFLFTQGQDVGQKTVANSKTKSLRDVYGWLWESFLTGEFNEATDIFRDAISVLDQLKVRASGV